MYSYRKSVVRSVLVAVTLIGGACFQVGGCSLSGIGHFVANINPCGSVLNCDPITYRFIQSGYVGPGADPTVDPACTYPPFCNRMSAGTDPFSPP